MPVLQVADSAENVDGGFPHIGDTCSQTMIAAVPSLEASSQSGGSLFPSNIILVDFFECSELVERLVAMNENCCLL